jgi:hypothetical protein
MSRIWIPSRMDPTIIGKVKMHDDPSEMVKLMKEQYQALSGLG